MAPNSATMEIIGITFLMSLWLSLLIITIIFAYKKYSKTEEKNIKSQFLILLIAFTIIFFGDLVHTIGLDISISLNDPLGTLTIFNGSFAFQKFALFFDNFAFIIFYTIWELFVIQRYKNNKLDWIDTIILILATIAIFSILFSPFYTLVNINYIVAIYAIHNIAFIIFGLLTVLNLLLNAKNKMKSEPTRKDEKSLYLVAWGFIISFLFFILTLALLPINNKFGMMMIPKTFAYAFSLISLDLGFLRP